VRKNKGLSHLFVLVYHRHCITLLSVIATCLKTDAMEHLVVYDERVQSESAVTFRELFKTNYFATTC